MVKHDVFGVFSQRFPRTRFWVLGTCRVLGVSVCFHMKVLGSISKANAHLLVKRVNWGYLYTPIQTGTFECGYTPAYWGYTKYECDYTPITWGYPNIPSIGDMLLNAFIWHFRSHAGNAQMGTSPVGSVSTFPLAESDVCPRFTRFTNAHTHTPPPTPPPPHTHTHTKKSL